MIYIFLGIRFWFALFSHRNSLPVTSDIVDPKMEYEGMSGSIYWEDEGFPNPSYYLTRAFTHVLHYRTCLIVGSSNKIAGYGSKYFNKLIFKLAKIYFPDWIGFKESRCSYSVERADRIMRIEKVAEWRLKRMFDKEF